MGCKTGLPLSEHERIGRELKRVARLSKDLLAAVQDNYPPKSKQVKAAERFEHALTNLRSVLEDAAFAEHPGEETTRLNSCYYGESKTGADA